MNTSSRNIRWNEIWALVALDIAIVISWIAYNKYQPGLLEQFGFVEYGFELAILQGIILFATPPVAGYIADRIRQKEGKGLPIISLGINFVSMVFMVVALTVFANPGGWLVFLFPVLITLWLISMNVFHSPAISTIEMFVPAHKLPQVMAVFAVVMDLSQAIEPSIVDVIEFVGGPLTFAAGGLLVFGTGFWFSKVIKWMDNEGLSKLEEEEEEEHDHETCADPSHDHSHEPEKPKSNFLLVFVVGVLLGLATTFFFNLFPVWSEGQLSFVGPDGIKGTYFISILIGFAALISYPISFVVQRQGVEKMALAGSLLAAFLIVGLSFSDGTVAMAMYALFPIAFAVMTVSYLPIAFLNLSSAQKVFGIGLFFSGVELANSAVDILQAGSWL